MGLGSGPALFPENHMGLILRFLLSFVATIGITLFVLIVS